MTESRVLTYVFGLHRESITQVEIFQAYNSAIVWNFVFYWDSLRYLRFIQLFVHRRLSIPNIFNIVRERKFTCSENLSFYVLKIVAIKYHNINIKLNLNIIKAKMYTRKGHFLSHTLILDLRDYSKFIYTVIM